MLQVSSKLFFLCTSFASHKQLLASSCIGDAKLRCKTRMDGAGNPVLMEVFFCWTGKKFSGLLSHIYALSVFGLGLETENCGSENWQRTTIRARHFPIL